MFPRYKDTIRFSAFTIETARTATAHIVMVHRLCKLWYLFLHYEKSGDHWMRTYNISTFKAYSIIFVIKRVIETAWDPGIFLDPFFSLSVRCHETVAVHD